MSRGHRPGQLIGAAPDWNRKLSAAASDRWLSPEQREAQSRKMRAYWDRRLGRAPSDAPAAPPPGLAQDRDGVEMPAWVPPDMADMFWSLVDRYGEIDACRHIRRLKRARAASA